MNDPKTNKLIEDAVRLKSYVLGYVFSICLTFEAYFVVVRDSYSTNKKIVIIIILALIQFVMQLYYFLHLGVNRKSKWKLFVLLFMILIVLILVLGTLWIMSNLNYRMTPQQINNYMQSQGGF
jgi:cytochrome o ubiquinol oxidase operon protein cyoD